LSAWNIEFSVILAEYFSFISSSKIISYIGIYHRFYSKRKVFKSENKIGLDERLKAEDEEFS